MKLDLIANFHLEGFGNEFGGPANLLDGNAVEWIWSENETKLKEALVKRSVKGDTL